MSRIAISLGLGGLLLASLGAGGYFAYQQYQAQEQLGQLLQQLDAALATQNDEAAKTANNTLQLMEAAVAKNRNEPAELAVLHRAQALNSHVQQLCDTLRSLQQQLCRATGGPVSLGTLRDPEATATTTRLIGSGTSGRRALRQQLAACLDALRQLGPASATPPTEPMLDGLPTAGALAALTQLEAQMRASEASTLQHLARHLGAPRIPIRYVAAATAEQATIAPGDTYRARLLVVKSLQLGNLRMYCNGHPVPTGAVGVGLIRFRAPTKLGLASWTAAIRLNHNGRDTTFVARVPYRVARR